MGAKHIMEPTAGHITCDQGMQQGTQRGSRAKQGCGCYGYSSGVLFPASPSCPFHMVSYTNTWDGHEGGGAVGEQRSAAITITTAWPSKSSKSNRVAVESPESLLLNSQTLYYYKSLM